MYIEEAAMISQLRKSTGGIKGLGKVDKIYLDNTNLIYSLAEENENIGKIRETFFLNQMRVKHSVTSSDMGVFRLMILFLKLGDLTKNKSKLRVLRMAT